MKQKIKLVYFINSIVFGGVEQHLVDLINFNNAELFDIYLLCPEEVIPQFKDAIKVDVPIFPIKVRSLFAVKQIIRLIKLLKEIDADIVNSHLYFSSRFASPIAGLLGVPVVIETAHIVEGWRKGYRKLLLLLDIMALVFVDGVIAVSRAVADYYITNKKVHPSKVKVIHNWCDFERFDPRRYTDDYKKERKQIMEMPPGYKILTLVGRLEEQKGHRFLIEALPNIRSYYPEIIVLFIGEGTLRNDLSHLAENFGVCDCISFLGFVNDVREILLISDIVVLPSMFEGLPLTLLEASAMEVPVVASRIDGTIDIVQDGETGLLFEPGNVNDLSSKIITLLRDEDRAKEMGKNGYDYVRRHFGVHEQVNATQNHYMELLKKSNVVSRAEI